ncbi:CD1871A family CXXC motif-containing protein [Ruminococcus sp.]|uniref:CD1871A family CXXC motif-containing protein n=1 Tax=Ruminococcus sp. TaxID=41978 RepID=UPI0025CEA87E|nr:CD1871A family CXXC motif-containing protein [Ruminococcus sp.]
MEKTKAGNIRDTVIKIIQAVLCTAYVMFMSVQVIGIYSSGSAAQADDPKAQIYTQDIAADAVIRGLPLLILSAAVTAAAAVLGVRNRNNPFNDPVIKRDIVTSGIKTPTAEMLAERSKQKRLHTAGRICFAAAMVPIILYMTNASHFDRSDAQGIESVIADMVMFILPWTIIGVGALAVSFILIDKSVKKEIELAADCERNTDTSKSGEKRSKAVIIVRCAALAASAVLIIAGIYNGGANVVLSKAITICTECIGLG